MGTLVWVIRQHCHADLGFRLEVADSNRVFSDDTEVSQSEDRGHSKRTLKTP